MSRDDGQLGVGIIGGAQVTRAIHLAVLYSLPELFRVAHLVDASSAVDARVAPGVDVPRGTGPHTLFVALTLAGFPAVKSVSAQLESRAPDEGDDYASVELRLAGGAAARVKVSWREAAPRSGAVVTGTTGEIEMSLLPHVRLVLKRGGEATELPVEQAYAGTAAGGYVGKFGYRLQMESFLRAFRDGTPPARGRRRDDPRTHGCGLRVGPKRHAGAAAVRRPTRPQPVRALARLTHATRPTSAT